MPIVTMQKKTGMKKTIQLVLLVVAVLEFQQYSFAQSCGTRQLDPRVAAFLKFIPYQELTLEELRNLPIERIKYAGPPFRAYPKEDVNRITITADSIRVLVFNPFHAKNLPIIINYHGGGFISPLLPGLEESLWLDAKNYGAI